MPSVLIVVCVRARLLARSAASIRPVMAGPVVPAARAARAASLIWGRAADPDAGQPQDLADLDPPARGHEVRDGPGYPSGRA